MAESQLPTASGTGSQSSTQSPQSATGPAASGSVAGGVQPGTDTNLLNSSPVDGMALHSTGLTTVNLAGNTTSSTQVAQPAHQRHINPALAGFSIGLFLLAVVLFWLTSRPVKSTT